MRTKALKISCELSPRCPPQEIPEQARAIEAAGFHRIWVRDMITSSWEMWSAATACALATKRVRIGLDVTNVYTRNIAVTAHAAASLDNLSRGRLDLGFGRGIPHQLGLMGIKTVEGSLERGIRLVRQLLGGKSVKLTAHQGKGGLRLAVRPSQKQMAIYLAATEEKDFKLAGRVADGALTISASRHFLAQALAWLKESGKRRKATIPLATWCPFSQSETALDEYLERMVKFLPQRFFHRLGLAPGRTNSAELKEVLVVNGLADLAKKVKELSRWGISEMILEYLTIKDLQGTTALIKES